MQFLKKILPLIATISAMCSVANLGIQVIKFAPEKPQETPAIFIEFKQDLRIRFFNRRSNP